jgi:hypothetical protein
MAPKPLETALSEWLETQGYPLEMEVAKEFRSKQFQVGQGGYYKDPDTGIQREIDVTASKAQAVRDFILQLVCFVECKVSRSKPWVLFTSIRDPTLSRTDHYSMVASPLGMMFLGRIHGNQASAMPRIFGPRDRVAYGITEALGERQNAINPAFAAVIAAAKAAVARANLTREEVSHDPMPEPLVDVLIPVVVLDGYLFEYFLDLEGQKQLRRIHSGLLSLGHAIPGRERSTLVHVITREGLPEFVGDLSDLYSFLLISVEGLHDKLLKRWELILAKRKTQNS